MSPDDGVPPRVLIVDDDPDNRDLLEQVLSDAGYAVYSATAPAEAGTLVATMACQLVLAELFPGAGADRFAALAALCAAVAPRPVGLLTSWSIPSTEAVRRGAAFVMPKPFELERLLLAIALNLAQPLTPAREHQGQVVQRYFAALSARDLAGILALCTGSVRYELPPLPFFGARVHGNAALEAPTEETLAHVPVARFTAIAPYATPRGIAARYRVVWPSATGADVQQEGAVLFTLEGERIAAIGVHLDEARLRQLLGVHAE